MGKLFTVALLCLLCMKLSAQTDSNKHEKFSSYHNFRIGFGVLPENYFKSEQAAANQEDETISSKTRGFYTHSLYLNYMYAPAYWLEWGIYGNFISRRQLAMIYSDGSINSSYTDFLVSVMPAIRINWLNKNWVKMYSSLAVGAYSHWSYRDGSKTDGIALNVRPTAQLLLIGISVGKNLYGFADFFGVGSLGLVSFGLGYKLPSKQTHK